MESWFKRCPVKITTIVKITERIGLEKRENNKTIFRLITATKKSNKKFHNIKELKFPPTIKYKNKVAKLNMNKFIKSIKLKPRKRPMKNELRLIGFDNT